MRGLDDKVAIITGAGSGLGRGMALRLVEEGVKVAVLDIDEAGAEETVHRCVALGGQACAVATDITDYANCESSVAEVERLLGTVNILVNNAGWDKALPFMETDPELWRKIIDINLYGPLNMHHVVAPRMLRSGGGKIINIASDAGRVGSSGEAVYSACKGGVIAFSKTLSREIARKGVIINTVCPGPSDTPLFADFAGSGEAGEKLRTGLARAIPLGRLGTPDDIAGIVAFLASDEGNFIVGQTISVSGGLTMHG
jgi:2-hydroxycyclohexanecarboxyl-CoA dehydrogenase